jgi:hypothetical protein
VQHKQKYDAQNEWRWHEQDFTEFEPALKEYYQDSTVLHNWTDSWQSKQMHLCTEVNMQRNWLVLKFDHGNGCSRRRSSIPPGKGAADVLRRLARKEWSTTTMPSR